MAKAKCPKRHRRDHKLRQCNITRHRRMQCQPKFWNSISSWEDSPCQMKQKEATPYDNVVNESATEEKKYWGTNGEWLWIFLCESSFCWMCINDMNKSNESTRNATSIWVREQTFIVSYPNQIESYPNQIEIATSIESQKYPVFFYMSRCDKYANDLVFKVCNVML